MTAPRSLVVAVATCAGLAAGWVLAQQYLDRNQRALFSPALRRRHAALGYLAGRRTPDTVRLLRDYLAWETHPRLRKRATRVIRQVEAAVG